MFDLLTSYVAIIVAWATFIIALWKLAAIATNHLGKRKREKQEWLISTPPTFQIEWINREHAKSNTAAVMYVGMAVFLLILGVNLQFLETITWQRDTAIFVMTALFFLLIAIMVQYKGDNRHEAELRRILPLLQEHSKPREVSADEPQQNED